MDCDLQGLYQLGVMYYDGLGTVSDVVCFFSSLIHFDSSMICITQ